MIDPATIRIVIENLRNNGFTTAQEKLLGVVLAHVPEIQQCEIIEILELSDPHSRHTLQQFVEKKLIDSFGRRDVFYRPTELLKHSTGRVQPPTGRAQPPTGRAQPPTGRAQPPTGRAQPPTGTVEPAPVSPESRNVITLNNLTELNKPTKDSNFSLGAQAEVPTAPVDPTLTGDGNAPMPGGSATSGKAGDTVPRSLPSPDAPKSPETGQRNEIVPFEAKVPEPLTPIAYADFVAQTVLATARLCENPPPVKSTPASQPPLPNIRVIKNENGITYGSVFCTDTPTDSF